MANTVFYAWQSDRPAEINKKFIRVAIDDAVASINAELGVEDAVRADRDTQGVAGDVTVAEVIFAKIDRCRIFVADITPVTPKNAPRTMPNPNVLIEYGRASVRPGSLAVVQVFNQAFGDWEKDRPFDLRHKRKPVIYTLKANATTGQFEKARRSLAQELAHVFRQILNAEQPGEPLPAVSDFATLRDDYARTWVNGQRATRVIGFWVGLRPLGDGLTLPELWDRPDLPVRRVSHAARVGQASLRLETMDGNRIDRSDIQPIPREGIDRGWEPMQGGARTLRYTRYTDHDSSLVLADAVSVCLREDGRIALAARTSNLVPGPHLNVRWILADLANALSILHRVRTVAGNPLAPYALIVELRYDDQRPNGMEPVRQGEWRLCPLDDEQGNSGPLMTAEPVTVGPFLVSGLDLFPEVMMRVYTGIVTSGGRRPERNLDFSPVTFG